LTDVLKKIKELQDWDIKKISELLKEVAKETGQPSKVVMQVLRYAVAGLEPGVGVPAVIEILGKDTVSRRIERCRSRHLGS
jgi:glutamyl/glutaminyl-tRNA synthetase